MDFTSLSNEQRKRFDEDGFLIVRGALDAGTVARLIEAGDRLVESPRTSQRQRSPDGQYDGFRNCITLDPAFEPLLMWSKTVPLLLQLFGSNVQLATSHLIYKYPDPPGTPPSRRLPGWHRDIAGVPDDLGHASVPRMEAKIAYYLTDLSEPACGATLMAPGSHLLKERLKIDAQTGDPEKVCEPSLRPGDAVIFENRTWHAGGVNLSKRIRKAVMFGYAYRWLKPMDYLIQPKELVERMDPIGRQLLGGTDDFAGAYVPGGGGEPIREWLKTHCS